MEFIFPVVFRGLFFFTAAHFKIYSHSQTLIFPFLKPVQALLAKKWKRSNPSSVFKAFHAKLPSHLKYAPVCQGSTCKQSAARSETPKAWLPCCKAVGRKKSARYYTNYKPCPFFPTSWQQLKTPSEVQLSYRYKTFHNRFIHTFKFKDIETIEFLGRLVPNPYGGANILKPRKNWKPKMK